MENIKKQLEKLDLQVYNIIVNGNTSGNPELDTLIMLGDYSFLQKCMVLTCNHEKLINMIEDNISVLLHDHDNYVKMGVKQKFIDHTISETALNYIDCYVHSKLVNLLVHLDLI